MNDIFNTFEKLGVRSVVEGNIVTFYDIESGLQMEIWEDKTKELSLDKLIMGKYYTLALKSPSKMFRFQLKRPKVNGKLDETKAILERVCYGNDNEFHVVDLMPGRNIAFEVKTDYISGDKIHVEAGNYIYFDINNRFGVYDNGFQEGYYLNEDEMREALETSKAIKFFCEYYGRIYPELAETLENAKSRTRI